MTKKYLPFVNGMNIGGARTQHYLHEVHCTIVEQLAMLGLSKQDIAHTFFHINASDFEQWEAAYPDFSDAYEQGSIMADAAVTKSLFNRARGVTVTKQKIGRDNEILEIEEELPPDTAACLAWLERKRGQNWIKDKAATVRSGDPLDELLKEIESELVNASVLPQGSQGDNDDEDDGNTG